ncbi:DUF5958 family protein, partial [Streptomyces sp. NPDC053076]|uniref:DUF5958 family protein n=1 Tax=Streptomyces sp. NPDC053076 TaxID=3365696 RepID=UPI0037D07F3C
MPLVRRRHGPHRQPPPARPTKRSSHRSANVAVPVKAFRVLVSVFTIADTRRRETYCKGACGHPG